MAKKTLICIIGTRPEAIKFMSVIRALRAAKTLTPYIIATGQHESLLNQALAEVGIVPNLHLHVMTENQTPAAVIAKLLTELPRVIEQQKNVAGILVQGDTATAYAGALVGFSLRIPIGHIEAGLRTYNLAEPYPEEGLRQMIDRLSTWCFAPTDKSRKNLAQEHISRRKILVTGNTIIDATKLMRPMLKKSATILREYGLKKETTYILLTAHRRENQGKGFLAVAQAIKKIASEHPTIHILYPVHPNPNVSGPMHAALDGLPTVHLIPPLGYRDFLSLMQDASLIISDSGGVQEEASVFQVPVVLLRDVTERPEGVIAGITSLVGCHPKKIVSETNRLLHKKRASRHVLPFGDGHAAQKICMFLEKNV